MRKIISVCLLSSFLIACANTKPAYPALSLLNTKPTSFDTSSQKAKPNEVILQQDFKPKSTARLQANLFHRNLGGVGRVKLPENQMMYSLTSSYVEGIIYCPVGRVVAKSCLRDSDNDEKFDTLHFQDTLNSGAYALSSGNLTVGEPLEDAVPYKLINSEDAPSQTIGVRVQKSFTKGWYFELVTVQENGNRVDTITNDIVRFDSKLEFPQQIKIESAEFEILSVSDGAVEYRVKSGFDAETAISLTQREVY